MSLSRPHNHLRSQGVHVARYISHASSRTFIPLLILGRFFDSRPGLVMFLLDTPYTGAMADLLPIPAGNFGAYLFDLDGTVADSMPLHLITWQQAARDFGGSFPEDLFWQWGGIPLPKTVEMLNERFGYHMDPTEVVHHKEQLFLKMLDQLHPIAAVAAHVTLQHGKIPMAIVSGSPRLTIERSLDALKLSDRFDVIVGAEDYTHGKPDPEPFLLAARLLNVPASECLVFEDAEAGIKSAQAAGMQWVRVPVQHLPAATTV